MARTDGTDGVSRQSSTVSPREQREYLSDEYRKMRNEELLVRTVAEIADENDGIRRCVALEGEASFYSWWNDDALVPPMGPRRVRIRMLEERIDALTLPSPDPSTSLRASGRGEEEVKAEEVEHGNSIADEKSDG